MVQYQLSAADVIRMLGCTMPDYREGAAEKSRLELFEEECHQKIPPMLYEFLGLADDNPLFGTADIWVSAECHLPYFSYVDIAQQIEQNEKYWARAPKKYEENEYYQFSKIPREQWKDKVSNYLQIGSDYAAGVVCYGICEADLEREDPPVYYWNEDNSITDWQIMTEKLSDFLGGIVCDMIAGVEYSTVQDILEEEEESWEFCRTEYNSEEALRAELGQHHIDLDSMRTYPSISDGEDEAYRICADEEAGALYLIQNKTILLVLQRVEQE